MMNDTIDLLYLC